MKSRKGAVWLIAAGALIALGPVWGMAVAALGMLRAFGTLAETGAGAPGHLASDISLSLRSTAAGYAVSPLGLAMMIWGIVRLVRIYIREDGLPRAGRT